MSKLLRTFLLAFALMIAMCASAFAAPPVDVEYFWGDGCSHCAELEPWLEKTLNEYGDKVSFNSHETWKHPDEARKFTQLMRMYGISESEQGTPTILVNGKVLIGTKDIEEKLKGEIDAGIAAPPSSPDKLLGSIDNGNQKQAVPSLSSDSASIKAIFLTALVDSINPCAIMVLVILLSSLIVYQKENRKRLIATAASFILAVYITYFAIGLGITHIVASAGVSQIVTLVVGFIAILVGLANLKDAFFYRKGNWAIEIPQAWRTKMTQTIMKATSPIGAFVAGATVTMFELPCTGGPYLFGLSLISNSTYFWERISLLAFYNIVFISPLVLIAALVIKGSLSIEKAEKMRNDNVKLMHLITGIVMVLVGIWAVFFH